MLHEHRVLTTHAIATMAFDSDHRARRRLLRLYDWDVVDRFAPRLPSGTAPMHYVLGGAGAAVLAAQAGLPVGALGYRRDDTLAIAHHHTLAHTVAVNDLFAHLVRHTVHGLRGEHDGPDTGGGRGGGGERGIRLDRWWSEARCRRHLDYVRPDGYGRTTSHIDGATVMFEWFLELDFATSTLGTLARKIDRYAQLAATTRPRPVLLWLPTPAREAHARDRLTRAQQATHPDLVPVATATAAIAARPREPATDTGTGAPGALGPADPVWLPLGRHGDAGRLDLTGLTQLWPAQTGDTLADPPPAAELTELPGTTTAAELPAPRPVPPAPAAAPRSRGDRRAGPRR